MSGLFQSVISFFNPDYRPTTQTRSSRQAISYTNDAFSLPMHSPGASVNFHDEPDSAMPFTYPPSGGQPLHDPYDLSSHGRSREPVLPMYSSHSASQPYPSLRKSWERIRLWLTSEYPELEDTLNFGILPETLREIELQLGMQLPQAIRDSYLVVNGQEAESSAGCSEGLFFGLTFLPLEEVLDEWRFWREVDDDPSTGSNPHILDAMYAIPPGWVRKLYSCRGWIPLMTDKAGNYIGIDLAPDEQGQAGQVIVFGRDFDTKIVLYHGEGPHGWANWLANYAEDLETGDGFEVRGSDDAVESDDDASEDSVGFEGYFFSANGGAKSGDAGATGGLRFTGEYKGWSAIEVWADKSYKSWHAAGLAPEPEDDTPPVDESELTQEAIPSEDLIASDAQPAINIVAPTEKPTTSLVSVPEGKTSTAPLVDLNPDTTSASTDIDGDANEVPPTLADPLVPEPVASPGKTPAKILEEPNVDSAKSKDHAQQLVSSVKRSLGPLPS